MRRASSPEGPERATRLVVSADDFGLAEAVNEGIVHAHRGGIVTAASLIANGAAFDDAVRRARAVPSLDIGVHLTLVEERPLLGARAVPSLVGRDGRFHPSAAHFTWRALRGRIDPGDVRRELAAQCERVVAAGVAPSHLDSHQHTHVLPVVLDAVLELGRQLGVTAVRVPREPAPLRRVGAAPLRRVGESLVLGRLARRVARATRGCDGLAGFLEGGRLDQPRLLGVIERLPRGTWELMTHPGSAHPGPAYAHWGYHWRAELDALVDADVAAAVRRRGIELISFRALAAQVPA